LSSERRPLAFWPDGVRRPGALHRIHLGGLKVQNNVSLYTSCILEDDVFCGPSMVFTNVVNPRSHVSRRDEYKRTLVHRGASLGANSTVVCGVTIGRYAFIGAGSVVTRDVPGFALIYGNPTRIRGWMCACGVKLELATDSAHQVARCGSCGKEYVRDGTSVVDEVPVLSG
jgi:UDP-2-acetamido-3-amino-2,3-dideoxy-glucuronate N-acetyltransferase